MFTAYPGASVEASEHRTDQQRPLLYYKIVAVTATDSMALHGFP